MKRTSRKRDIDFSAARLVRDERGGPLSRRCETNYHIIQEEERKSRKNYLSVFHHIIKGHFLFWKLLKKIIYLKNHWKFLLFFIASSHFYSNEIRPYFVRIVKYPSRITKEKFIYPYFIK